MKASTQRSGWQTAHAEAITALKEWAQSWDKQADLFDHTAAVSRISLTRYAEIKAQLAKEGEARQAQEVAGNEFMVERARYFSPFARGERPWPK